MGVLQTPALPLGYVATNTALEREMGFEPTTFSLARRRSTPELLPRLTPHIIPETDQETSSRFDANFDMVKGGAPGIVRFATMPRRTWGGWRWWTS